MTPTSVAVFARAPVVGAAKTRLVPRLGRQGAARLQRLFMARAVRIAQDAAVGAVSLWCAPDCSHRAFTAIERKSDVKLFPQRGDDLGARMLAAFEVLCRAGPALLIGTDCPALTAATLRDAAQALDAGEDAVLVPAEDGGYVLIGLRRAEPSLFDTIPWSTGRVTAETRARLQRSGLRWRELAVSWDVDRPEDVDRLLASALMPELHVLRR